MEQCFNLAYGVFSRTLSISPAGGKMIRFDSTRWLAAAALSAALMAAGGRGFSQSSAPAPDRGPAQNPASPAVVPPASASPQIAAPASPPNAAPAAAPSHPAAPQQEQAPPSQPTVSSAPPTAEEIGDSLQAHQRYQAAIAAYAQDPNPSAHLWNKMGIAYQLMFNLKDAARCYKASLKLNPDDAQVINNLGTVYDSLKDYHQAERLYRKALKIDPNSAVVLKNLGTNLMAQKKVNKGWEAYQKALAIDPTIFEERGGPRVTNPASAADRGAINYYMARGCARAGLSDCAIQYLRLALNEGYTTPRKLEHDSDFSPLRGIPGFDDLLKPEQPTSR
jgi:tetratricopeptide (TPR) repeat protein